jgi:hypothetical protein
VVPPLMPSPPPVSPPLPLHHRTPDLLCRLDPPGYSPPIGRPAQTRRRVRERRKGDKRGKREGSDVDTLTCEAHVGRTLTLLPHRINRDQNRLGLVWFGGD